MLTKNIIDFYANKTVFVTGATGLLGKSIIEKLLRSCCEIKSIYILIRPKKGATVSERLENLLTSEVFDLIRNENPQFLKKIRALEGNVMDVNFGLSESDFNAIINNVSIVIHAAATVRFNEPLKLATEMNLVAVIKIIDLCKQIKSLEILVHISTAYSNCEQSVIHETVYPPSYDPHKLIDIVQHLDEGLVDLITPGMIKDKPNTYTFTKQLAECVLQQQSEQLPIVIIRPSIIGAAVAEPFPGWIDNFNAATGLIAAISKGVLRSMMGDYTKFVNIVPVDTTANFIIATAWYSAGTYGTKLTNGSIHNDESNSSESSTKVRVTNNYLTSHEDSAFIPVYNYTIQSDKVTWGTFVHSLLPRAQLSPSISCHRFPNFHMTTFSWYHDIKWALSHIVPAALLDILQVLQGHTPKNLNGMDKLKKITDTLSYFTLNHWRFDCNNRMVIWRAMSDIDKKNFNIDLSNIDWISYFQVYHVGMKRYALKENSIQKSFSLGKRLRVLYFGFRYLSVVAILLFLVQKIHVFNGLFYQLIRILIRISRQLRML